MAGARYAALLARFGVLPGCSRGERPVGARLHLGPLRFPPSRGKKGGNREGGIIRDASPSRREAGICEPLTRVKRTLLTWVPREESVPRG